MWRDPIKSFLKTTLWSSYCSSHKRNAEYTRLFKPKSQSKPKHNPNAMSIPNSDPNLIKKLKT